MASPRFLGRSTRADLLWYAGRPVFSYQSQNLRAAIQEGLALSMCGINGLVNCGDGEALARMTHVQTHRGPDDSGIWDQRFPDGSYIGLGSRRLAILDLSSSGRMPMCNEDRTVWITYNGEIYNFRGLRDELVSKGHQFFSHTDTEVVLRLYEHYGKDCVHKLNGIFAFSICDLRSGSRQIFLARDHFGVKPLYYWHRGSKLALLRKSKLCSRSPVSTRNSIL